MDFCSQLISSDLSSQIGTGVSCSWIYRIYREFELLAGKSAPNNFIQLLVYKAMTFSNEIEKIDTVRAYHVSLRLSGTGQAFSHRILYTRAAQTTLLRSTSSWTQAHRCGKRMTLASNSRIRLRSFPMWSEHSSTLITKRPIPP